MLLLSNLDPFLYSTQGGEAVAWRGIGASLENPPSHG